MSEHKELVDLKLTAPAGKTIVVVDKAATACRIAHTSGGQSSCTIISLKQLTDNEIVNYVEENISKDVSSLKVFLVGIGANNLLNVFKSKNVCAEIKPKFDAKVEGFHYCLKNIENFIQKFDDALPLPPFIPGFMGHVKGYPALLCITGATTSYLILNEDGTYEPVSSSYCGRDLYLSLGRCLTHCKSDVDLVQLAESGDQYKVTVCMDEIMGPKTDNVGDVQDFLKLMPFRLEIFPFGRIIQEKFYDPETKDVAKAFMHAVVEDLQTNVMLLWETYNVKNVYLAGSFFSESTVMRKCAEKISYQLMGAGGKPPPTPRFCKYSDNLATIGVLVNELKG